jgi:hypothetical protein
MTLQEAADRANMNLAALNRDQVVELAGRFMVDPTDLKRHLDGMPPASQQAAGGAQNPTKAQKMLNAAGETLSQVQHDANDWALRGMKHRNWDELHARELRQRERAEEMRGEADRAGAVAARDERAVAGERTESAAKSAGNLAADSLGGSAGGGAAGIARMQAAQQARDKEGAGQLQAATERKDLYEQKEVNRRANAASQRELAAETAMTNASRQAEQEMHNNEERIKRNEDYNREAAERDANVQYADTKDSHDTESGQSAAPPPPAASANSAPVASPQQAQASAPEAPGAASPLVGAKLGDKVNMPDGVYYEVKPGDWAPLTNEIQKTAADNTHFLDVRGGEVTRDGKLGEGDRQYAADKAGPHAYKTGDGIERFGISRQEINDALGRAIT